MHINFHIDNFDDFILMEFSFEISFSNIKTQTLFFCSLFLVLKSVDWSVPNHFEIYMYRKSQTCHLKYSMQIMTTPKQSNNLAMCVYINDICLWTDRLRYALNSFQLKYNIFCNFTDNHMYNLSAHRAHIQIVQQTLFNSSMCEAHIFCCCCSILRL